MKIISISLSGFKNLEQTKIEFDRIVALVSPNNYGKSNFLQGIDFALTFLDAGEKSRRNMTSWRKGIPLNPSSAHHPFSFEVEFHEPSLGQYQYVRYGYSFSWLRDDATGHRIVDEWMEMRESESVKYTGYLKRNDGRYRKGKSTNAFRNITLGDFQLALDTLSAVDDVDYADVIKCIKNLSCQIYRFEDVRCRHQGNPYEKDPGTGRSYIEDTPDLLTTLKKNDPDRFAICKDAITALIPGIIDIEVAEAISDPPTKGNGTYANAYALPMLFIQHKHLSQPVDFSTLSTGTKRLLWIMATVCTSGSGTQLIAFEQLETNLHPRLFKQTLELVNEQLGDTCLLITSHSPYLVQYLKPERIYVGIPNETGLASFQTIAKGKSRALVRTAHDSGLSAAEYLFELMAGDAKSNHILNTFFRT